jgi:hypothetical protein
MPGRVGGARKLAAPYCDLTMSGGLAYETLANARPVPSASSTSPPSYCSASATGGSPSTTSPVGQILARAPSNCIGRLATSCSALSSSGRCSPLSMSCSELCDRTSRPVCRIACAFVLPRHNEPAPAQGLLPRRHRGCSASWSARASGLGRTGINWCPPPTSSCWPSMACCVTTWVSTKSATPSSPRRGGT